MDSDEMKRNSEKSVFFFNSKKQVFNDFFFLLPSIRLALSWWWIKPRNPTASTSIQYTNITVTLIALMCRWVCSKVDRVQVTINGSIRRIIGNNLRLSRKSFFSRAIFSRWFEKFMAHVNGKAPRRTDARNKHESFLLSQWWWWWWWLCALEISDRIRARWCNGRCVILVFFHSAPVQRPESSTN